jgi:hypothetical protein
MAQQQPLTQPYQSSWHAVCESDEDEEDEDEDEEDEEEDEDGY